MKYKFNDTNIESGETYYYKLESVNIFGGREKFDVLSVSVLLPQEFVLHQMLVSFNKV